MLATQSPALQVGDSRAEGISSSDDSNGPEATERTLEDHTTLDEDIDDAYSYYRQCQSQCENADQDRAAMGAAIRFWQTTDNEIDAKAEATGPVAEKPGQPEDKELPREANAKSVLNSAATPTCPTTGSTPKFMVGRYGMAYYTSHLVQDEDPDQAVSSAPCNWLCQGAGEACRNPHTLAQLEAA